MDQATKKRMEICFGSLILAVLLLFLIQSLSYPQRSRELPMIVDVAGIALVLSHLANVIRRKPDPAKQPSSVNWKAVTAAFGCMVAYLFVTYLVGMVIATFVLVLGTGLAFQTKKPKISALLAIIMPVFLQLVFVNFLRTPLYRGILLGR